MIDMILMTVLIMTMMTMMMVMAMMAMVDLMFMILMCVRLKKSVVSLGSSRTRGQTGRAPRRCGKEKTRLHT